MGYLVCCFPFAEMKHRWLALCAHAACVRLSCSFALMSISPYAGPPCTIKLAGQIVQTARVVAVSATDVPTATADITWYVACYAQGQAGMHQCRLPSSTQDIRALTHVQGCVNRAVQVRASSFRSAACCTAATTGRAGEHFHTTDSPAA